MNYLVRKPWDSGGVLWLENNPKFIFSSGIQRPNIILVSTNIIEREDFSEPPCCFYEGIMCQSQLSGYPPDSQSTAPAGFEGSCSVLLPHQHREDPRSGMQASQTAEMHPRHLPGPGRCGSGHDGHLHPFGEAAGGWAEDPGTPEKLADICIWTYELLFWCQCQSKLAC